MNWSEFFAMGGYGLYVWGSYGCAALVLVFNLVSASHKHKATLKMLREYSRLEEAGSE
jgi:heme exporter protein D